jgi:hypothetical protein
MPHSATSSATQHGGHGRASRYVENTLTYNLRIWLISTGGATVARYN